MTWKKYTLEERKEIYSRPLEEQFVRVYENGEAVVLRHLIRSTEAEDYGIVLEVAKAFALSRNGAVWILPEINAHETALRNALGLSASNGRTPDLMIGIGTFIDVKSPRVMRKLSKNAGKAFRQSAIACITDMHLQLDECRIAEYTKRIFGQDNYRCREVYFFMNGVLSKRTKGNP